MHISLRLKTIISIILLSCLQTITGQKLICKWSFDNSTNFPDSGQGTVLTTGGAVFTSFVGGNPSSGKAYGTNSYPAQSQSNEKAGLHIKISTSGLKNIKLKFEQYRSNTSSKKTMVLVSTDGINYMKTDSLLASSGSTWASKIVDLKDIATLNNQSEIHILLVSSFVGSQYVASGSTSTYSTSGTWRFDNISVYGYDTAKPVVKTIMDISVSKKTLSEGKQDTVQFIFTLQHTFKSDLLQKVAFEGTGIFSGDFSWIGDDSIIIMKGSLTDTLLMKINDDAEVEGPETGLISLPGLDTNMLLDSNPVILFMDDDMKTIAISEVQGKKSSSEMLNQLVAVEGVVTCDLQDTGEHYGFYIQDLIPDGDSLSSDGMFIMDSGAFDVEEGDLVRVKGKVKEVFGQTSLHEVGSVVILSKNHSIAPVDIRLPLDSLAEPERFEGMKVRFLQQLTVTDNYNLGRYGEFTVSANGRTFNPCDLVDPNDVFPDGNSFEGASNIAAIDSFQKMNDLNSILVCDRLSIQNPSQIPFIDTVDKTLRCGSLVDSLEGVLGYAYGKFRIFPSFAQPVITYAKRQSAPIITGANLKVAGMNVLNYFNGDGKGGGFPGERGALSVQEFARQKAKIVAAIIQLNADVIGLMEMENDGDSGLSAIHDLVESLNRASGGTVYDYIRDAKGMDGNPGTDPIKVALIYKPGVLTPAGTAKNHNDAAFSGLGRPPLAQTFRLKSNGEQFTVIVNHFKSKGCSSSSDSLDFDRHDGQGCFNSTRKKQAFALLDFVSKLILETGDSDVVVLGDFNAYTQEDPLDILRAFGLKELFVNSYSYIFEGQAGSLDHAFATRSMYRAFTGGSKWHINSDEPTFIDYTLSFKKQDVYEPDAYRSSDHDPLIAGFNLVENKEDIRGVSDNEKLRFYPQPNFGIFTIDYCEIGKYDIMIYSVTGLLLHTELHLEGISIIHTNLDPGMYFMFVHGEGGTFLEKFVIGKQ